MNTVLNIVLWALQVLLALMFLMAGSTKASQPLDKISRRMTWVTATPPALVRFIGISEIAGALGLILPAVTHILPVLTIAAAIGLAIIMVLAALFHVSRGEYNAVVVNAVILVLLIIVIYGRLALVTL